MALPPHLQCHAPKTTMAAPGAVGQWGMIMDGFLY